MNKINANSFPWVPINLVFYDFERFYINMNWLNRSTGFWYDPIYQAVDLDPKLRERKALKKNVMLTINQTPEYRLVRDGVPNLGDGHWTEVKLGKYNKDGTNPINWREEAEDFFKITARYGRKTWPKERLGVDETERWGMQNKPLSGLNLVSHIEPGNEDRAWWRPASTSVEPEEFAAYCSMVYDGHEQSVPFAGIKVADPSMLMVMPGLPNLDLDCLKRMDVWFKNNRRDKRFACDIINVHHYCNHGNTFENLTSQWTSGCSPEQDQIRVKLRTIVDFAKSVDLKVWWSEFGYNTNNTNTTQGIVEFAGKGTEQIQSEWLKRCYLEGILAGVDNMMMFETLDEPGAVNGGFWTTCGMAKSQYDPQPFAPKVSWYGLRDLSKWLKNTSFVKEENVSGVRVLTFRVNFKVRYVYYMPTSNGSTKQFTINGKQLLATEDPQMMEELRIIRVLPNIKILNPQIEVIKNTVIT